jgi:hypothetical protein
LAVVKIAFLLKEEDNNNNQKQEILDEWKRYFFCFSKKYQTR